MLKKPFTPEMAEALYGIQQQNISADNNRSINELGIRAIYKLNGVDLSRVAIYSNCLIVLKDGVCVDIAMPNDAGVDEIIRIYSDLCDGRQQS